MIDRRCPRDPLSVSAPVVMDSDMVLMIKRGSRPGKVLGAFLVAPKNLARPFAKPPGAKFERKRGSKSKFSA